MTNTKAQNQNQQYCSFCDYTGIVHNPHFNELGEAPLTPCPQCVLTRCKCGKEAPYYHFENNKIAVCSCRETRIRIQRINRIYSASGIDKKYQWKYLGDFEAKNKQSADAKNAAYDIVKNFPKVTKGLFFWGNPGTGKTLLSSIILTELITRHAIEGKFIKISRNLFNKLKATFVEGSDSYGESNKIEEELFAIDVLIIDDFGVQRDTLWEQETLYNLVDARYEAEKFTIFTSNKNPFESFKDLSGGRVLSRIKEMCRIMEISGQDQRELL